MSASKSPPIQRLQNLKPARLSRIKTTQKHNANQTSYFFNSIDPKRTFGLDRLWRPGEFRVWSGVGSLSVPTHGRVQSNAKPIIITGRNECPNAAVRLLTLDSLGRTFSNMHLVWEILRASET